MTPDPLQSTQLFTRVGEAVGTVLAFEHGGEMLPFGRFEAALVVEGVFEGLGSGGEVVDRGDKRCRRRRKEYNGLLEDYLFIMRVTP